MRQDPTGTKRTQSWPSLDPCPDPPTETACHPHFTDEEMEASLVSQAVKNPPAMWETCVPSLGQGDSPGEGNGHPLQYSGLENPKDRGDWWLQSMGVAESDTTD